MTAELYKLFLQMAIIGGITGILGIFIRKISRNKIWSSFNVFNHYVFTNNVL